MTSSEDTSDNQPPLGIVLVHGYRGSPADLAPLESTLVERYGSQSVQNLCLPDHGIGQIPRFDEACFQSAVAVALDRQRDQGRRLVLIGHSIGGSLALTEIARRLAEDRDSLKALLLLVLCATPPRIDISYAKRWKDHVAERESSIDDVRAFVSLVNRLARRRPLAVPAPVLFLHGDADELVPIDDAGLWRKDRLATAQRHVHIRGATHQLFIGHGAQIAIDAIVRAIDDARQRGASFVENRGTRTLFELLPGLESFCSAWPDSLRHVTHGPAGRRAVGEDYDFRAIAAYEPTLANIEITTRCNLSCPACARTQLKPPPSTMSREDFSRVLANLPHAFRVVLVGLGEPLMHPEVVDFIELAVAQERRVGLVTNGMLLDSDLSRALAKSGLTSITFSLDAADQSTANRVRPGSNIKKISENIHFLIDECRRCGVNLGTSAFTALRSETIEKFEAIVDFAADHELDALMVTDLNFAFNQAISVRHGFTPEHARAFRNAIKRAATRRLAVLSVWGLEEFALHIRYRDHLIFRGGQFVFRAERHGRCASPWQTIPVRVNGDLTVCDCQPETVIGNIHQQPLSAWWNGPVMQEHRRRMLSENPPGPCRICPRF